MATLVERINGLAAAVRDKCNVLTIAVAAKVSSVTGTAPIESTGGTNPAISIALATTASHGAMAAADKAKLDGLAPGAATSAGAADAGKAALLNPSGLLDFSLFKGGNRYAQYGPTIISRDINERINGSILQPDTYREALFSIISTSVYDVDQLLTLAKFGDDQRPVVTRIVKGRGTSDAPGRIQQNDFLFQEQIEAVTLPTGEFGPTGFTDRAGHAGFRRWLVDGPLIDGTYGEVPGIYLLSTGTGISSSSAYPNANQYFGVATAFVANSRQQVALPGQTFHRQSILNTRNPAGPIQRQLSPTPNTTQPRVDLGANLWIGPGASDPGKAPIKIDYLNTSLLAVPEPGVVEYDANADLYLTNAAGRRGRVMNNEIILYSNAAKMSRTGSTDQVALAMFTLPANALGPNGYMEARLLVSGTNTANDKRIYIQRAVGDNPAGPQPLLANLKLDGSLATAFEANCRWSNRGATNVQVSQGLRTNGAAIGPVYAPAAGSAQAIDTTQATTWTIYGYVSVATETISVESISVRAVYRE